MLYNRREIENQYLGNYQMAIYARLSRQLDGKFLGTPLVKPTRRIPKERNGNIKPN